MSKLVLQINNLSKNQNLGQISIFPPLIMYYPLTTLTIIRKSSYKLSKILILPQIQSLSIQNPPSLPMITAKTTRIYKKVPPFNNHSKSNNISNYIQMPKSIKPTKKSEKIREITSSRWNRSIQTGHCNLTPWMKESTPDGGQADESESHPLNDNKTRHRIETERRKKAIKRFQLRSK